MKEPKKRRMKDTQAWDKQNFTPTTNSSRLYLLPCSVKVPFTASRKSRVSRNVELTNFPYYNGPRTESLKSISLRFNYPVHKRMAKQTICYMMQENYKTFFKLELVGKEEICTTLMPSIEQNICAPISLVASFIGVISGSKLQRIASLEYLKTISPNTLQLVLSRMRDYNHSIRTFKK